MLKSWLVWWTIPISKNHGEHYSGIILGAMASEITSLTLVYWSIYSGVDHRKHQNSASLVFVWGIHRWPVNSHHKWPATRKMFPFDDVIMSKSCIDSNQYTCIFTCTLTHSHIRLYWIDINVYGTLKVYVLAMHTRGHASGWNTNDLWKVVSIKTCGI